MVSILLFVALAKRSGLAQWLASQSTAQGVPGSRPGRVAVHCCLEQVTFTPCLVLVKPMEAVDVRLTWTDFDEAGDYVVPNLLSPKDFVYRPENMDETVLHTRFGKGVPGSNLVWRAVY